MSSFPSIIVMQTLFWYSLIVIQFSLSLILLIGTYSARVMKSNKHRIAVCTHVTPLNPSKVSRKTYNYAISNCFMLFFISLLKYIQPGDGECGNGRQFNFLGQRLNGLAQIRRRRPVAHARFRPDMRYLYIIIGLVCITIQYSIQLI